MTEPKVRPLPMTAANARLVMDGLKWQSRRAVRPQPEAMHTVWPAPPDGEWHWRHARVCEAGYVHTSGDAMARLMAANCSPYGVAGDRLWMREPWAQVFAKTSPDATGADAGCIYRADGPEHLTPARQVHGWGAGQPWRQARFMFRWASRATLTLVDVRVERLHAITLPDIEAEGWQPRPELSTDPAVHFDAAHDWWQDTWVSINGLDSFKANPWVWVLEWEPIRAATRA